MLGHALVRRSGAPSWGALVERRITGPLGMRATFVDLPPAAIGRMAAGHGAGMDTVPPWHLDVLAGAGALRSTAADMVTYLAAQMDTVEGPLARAVALARAPRAELGGGNRIGLGWVVRGPADRPIWWHNGGTGGFRTFAAFDPERRVAVVVLANAAVSADDIGIHLLDPATPLSMPPVPPRRAVVPLSTADLDRLVGDYPLAPGFVLHVTREGDVLYLQATGQPKVRLWPTAPDRFFLKEVDAELVFGLPGSRPATSVTLLQNRISQTARRKR